MKLNPANLAGGIEERVTTALPSWGRRKALLVIYFSLAIVAVLYSIAPLIWMGITSLQPTVYLFSSPPEIVPADWTLEHYFTLVNQNQLFFDYYRNSVIVSVTTTGLTIFFGTLAAYSISRFEYFGKTKIDKFILLVYLFPGIVLVVPITIIVANWLNWNNTWWGLSIVYITFALPFSIWILREFFNSIPMSLEEAAMIDGASRMQAFAYVILPNALPGIIATAVFTWALAWNEFLFASVIMSQAEMQTLPVGLSQMLQTANPPWGRFMAANTLVTIPVIILFIFVQDYLVKGFGVGGVKG